MAIPNPGSFGSPPNPNTASSNQNRGSKAVAVTAVAGAVFLLVFLGILLIRRFSFSSSDESSPHFFDFLFVSADSDPETSKPMAADIDPETPPPTEGISNVGTRVSDVIYTPSGQVDSLRELVGDEWVDWFYVYDSYGMFLYRYRDIGTVDSYFSTHFVPGTDTTYSNTVGEVIDCVGFTLEYAVTEVYAGDGLGDRYLYLRSNGEWITPDVFSYSFYETAYYDFRFETPLSFDAFGTPRIHRDDSSFMLHQVLTDVLIADYTYVYLS